jgi:hypothetical protein
MTLPLRRLLACLGLLSLAGVLLVACRSARPLPLVDATQPGWQTQRFAALWRPPGKEAPEIAGDLFLTQHNDGRTLVNFTKLPFPSVTAWRAPGEWQIEFQPQRRWSGGKGAASSRFLLLWVPEAVAGAPVPPPIVVEKLANPPQAVRLRQPRTGETLTLFRQP